MHSPAQPVSCPVLPCPVPCRKRNVARPTTSPLPHLNHPVCLLSAASLPTHPPGTAASGSWYLMYLMYLFVPFAQEPPAKSQPSTPSTPSTSTPTRYTPCRRPSPPSSLSTLSPLIPKSPFDLTLFLSFFSATSSNHTPLFLSSFQNQHHLTRYIPSKPFTSTAPAFSLRFSPLSDLDPVSRFF